MKVSLQWLREFVDIELSPRQLADDLTNVGVVVETLEPVGYDFILGLDLTTNRPDCLSHLGVAREVATLYQKPLRTIKVGLEESQAMARDQISVDIEVPQLCARYCARVIRGVKVAPSPDWLRLRLEALGVRTTNNVADVTNYVLMEIGHPLHAFDLTKIGGSAIIVRESHDQESLVTIDGLERKLAPGMLVIADKSRPIALAGVMGGVESEISSSTRDVLLESAWFDPVSIQRTAKSLGMHTEASHRFERGADVNATVSAIDRAARLISELTGGEILRGVVDCYPRPLRREPVFLRKSRIARLMGSEIPGVEVDRILSMLNFKILRKSGEGQQTDLPVPRRILRGKDEEGQQQSAEGWQIDLPTSRLDVEREIDLIEEIARHYGYDKFPSSLPSWRGSSRRQPEQVLQRALRERLANLGYSESMTYSFIDELEGQRFSEHRPVRLLNPLSSETEVMRPSLLPGLLRSLLHNYHRGLKSAKLFEIGKIYFEGGDRQPREETHLAMVATGNAEEKSVHSTSRAISFFDMKGEIEILFGASWRHISLKAVVGEDKGQIPKYYHPSLSVQLAGEGIWNASFFGQLHPGICQQYKIRQPVWVAEIPLQRLPPEFDPASAEKIFHEIPRFPSVQRDISLVAEKDVTYSKIESIIRQSGIKEIQRIFPFDLYSGEHLSPGKKGISITVSYQASDRTLVEEEVNRYHETIVALLADKLGAELRN
jgi:phenylalanyl-tRNA synthetase beta chain